MAALVTLASLLTGCGAGDDAEAPADGDEPTSDTSPGFDASDAASPEVLEPADPHEDPSMDADEGRTLRGTLGGDAALEGGCAWVEAEGQRYEVLWPEGFQIAFDPVRLLGPDGTTVAGDGDDVELLGVPAEGMASICQVGPIFRADQVVDPG